MKKIIKDVHFILDGTLVFGDLHLENGYVERIDYKTAQPNGNLAIPGFIDIHTHGFNLHTCDDVSFNNLQALLLAYAQAGITSFCPTLSAHTLDEYAQIIDAYRNLFIKDCRGAKVLGFHLEGPFLNPKQVNAAYLPHIQTIDLTQLDEFLAKYHEDIKIMSISPEIPNAMDAIALLHLYGVEVSLGHTTADFHTTMQALKQGATQITHLCNKMPFIDHHQATMMDAIFLSDCRCELNMDRMHIQSKMLQWLIPLLGSNRIIATSDGTKFCGIQPNTKLPKDYTQKENIIYYQDQPFTTTNDLLDIFVYLYRDLQFSLSECIEMCSGNAAKIFKSYSNEIGLGKKIDLVILNHNLEIQDVIIDGISVF